MMVEVTEEMQKLLKEIGQLEDGLRGSIPGHTSAAWHKDLATATRRLAHMVSEGLGEQRAPDSEDDGKNTYIFKLRSRGMVVSDLAIKADSMKEAEEKVFNGCAVDNAVWRFAGLLGNDGPVIYSVRVLQERKE